jgi:DNA-binding LacI/PurR family transcriptional regulator
MPLPAVWLLIGVSIAIVSRVLHGSANVSAAAARVRAAA